MVVENERTSQSLNQDDEQISACLHHWIIEPAVGPVSAGSCQKCGEVKEFKNSIDYETEWTNRREMARSKSSTPVDALEEVDEIAD